MLPLSQPIRGVNGKMIHEIHIPKNTTVGIGVLATNRCKAIWGDDADGFNPNRWLERDQATLQKTFNVFSFGPRYEWTFLTCAVK